MLKLIEFDNKYIDQYKEAYLLALKEVELGHIHKHDLMFLNPDEVDVVQKAKDSLDEKKLKPGYVKSYKFMAIDNDKLIGIISIREHLTDKLLTFAGHIGYAINPKYWGLGYGKEMLKLALEEHKDLIEEDKILITCDDDNIGSYKIIEANGGILENKVENEEDGEIFLTRRYWIKK